MHWDIRDLKSRATKIEKSKEAPSKEQLNVLKAYLQKSRTEHEAIRERSREYLQPQTRRCGRFSFPCAASFTPVMLFLKLC